MLQYFLNRGIKIRTYTLKHEPEFEITAEIVLTTMKGFDGLKKISITSLDLHKYLVKGDIIFADDGTLKFIVKKVSGRDIHLIAHAKGVLKSAFLELSLRKGRPKRERFGILGLTTVIRETLAKAKVPS